ncbi:MAG: DUF6544 family protein [Caldicoprobacterales bacterium]
MPVFLGSLLLLICITIIYFKIPYSPIKQSFKNKVAIAKGQQSNLSGGYFKKEDFAHMPLAIQKYMDTCGYIGKAKMAWMKIPFFGVDFIIGSDDKKLAIDYCQYNFTANPTRYALIESSLFAIPFEGLDSLTAGLGGMKGMIAKSITLFNEKGPEMDKACLVTYLAESIFMPSSLLQGFIRLEEIDDYRVKGSISYKGIEAEGIFHFNDKFQMIKFTTQDRAETGADGKIEYFPWSAICSDYQTNEDGYSHPTVFKAVWHYKDRDLVYFDGRLEGIEYGGN